ncbi:hypothetical protein ACUY1T_07970 [Billgrantia sp. Q4P2]|uniref:hypothetical protein n=1 Tax=Billgrantia sp. Q4P2 TaxID=3463857 RepID=UPI0040563732
MTKGYDSLSTPWTQREIALLLQHYPVLEASEVRRQFLPHRSSNDIYTKAQQLGLHKAATADPVESPPWTEEELGLLRRHYDVLPGADLHRQYLPRRSVEIIQRKARRLGFDVPRHVASQPWTERELSVLQRHYAALGAAQVHHAHLPHRTVKAIQHKARQLNLVYRAAGTSSVSRRWTDEELARFRQHYGTLPVPELQRRYFPERSAAALRRLATGLGLSRADYSQPWSDEEIALLRHHYAQGGPPAAAKALPHRSSVSLRGKAKKLGLHCPVPVAGEGWTEEERQRLACLQHLPLPELLAHFPERSRRSIDSQRSRLRRGRHK